VSGTALIHSPPVRSDDLDFFAADASELYGHAEQPIFLFLIIGCEGVLVHDDKPGHRVHGTPLQNLGASFRQR